MAEPEQTSCDAKTASLFLSFVVAAKLSGHEKRGGPTKPAVFTTVVGWLLSGGWRLGAAAGAVAGMPRLGNGAGTPYPQNVTSSSTYPKTQLVCGQKRGFCHWI